MAAAERACEEQAVERAEGVGVVAAAVVLLLALGSFFVVLPPRTNRWLPGWLDRRRLHPAADPPEPEPEPEAQGAAQAPYDTRVPYDTVLIRGRVLDPPDGTAVPGALLTLVAANGAQSARTTSDEDGRYALPVPGSGAYTVVATSPSLGATSHSVLVADRDVELDLEPE